MEDDTTIMPFRQPGSILATLTEIARKGARQMLEAALMSEAAHFVALFTDERLPDGRQRVVRQSAGRERTIQTVIGPIPVRRPQVRDRASGLAEDEKVQLTSSILPK